MKYNPKHQLRIGGKMSEQGADKVGNKLANAALIAACGFVVAALIYVVRWW